MKFWKWKMKMPEVGLIRKTFRRGEALLRWSDRSIVAEGNPTGIFSRGVLTSFYPSSASFFFFFRRPAHAKWNGIVKGSLPRFLLPISACRMRRVRTSGTATSRTECRSSAAKSKFFFFVATKMGKEVFSPLAGVNPPHWFPFALTTKFDPWKSRLSLSSLDSIMLLQSLISVIQWWNQLPFREKKKELLLFFSRNLYIR